MLVIALGSGSSVAQGVLDDYPVRQRGMSYVGWWHNVYSSAEARQSLEDLTRTNTESIALLVTQYMDSLVTTTIAPIPDKTPTDDSLTSAIENARSLGLDVMLKPHVDIRNDAAWRGEIQFTSEADWRAWFDSYEAFILHYARFAESHGIRLFCVGTELKATTHRAADWRSVIQAVRSVFSGRLVYAANHDNIDNVAWFDDLDYIGIDAYFPLTNRTDPTLNDLLDAWQSRAADIEALQARFQKPVIFTEIGYVARDGTNTEPWACRGGAPADPQEQALCYEAAFRTFWNKPWFQGMYWWAWTAAPSTSGQCMSDFSPLDAPSEAVLARWYGNTAADRKWRKYR